MEKFLSALDAAISSWSDLSKEWETIEANKSDELAVKYPFNKDFREVLHDMLEWKEQLQNKS
jgi:hypothetical protein